MPQVVVHANHHRTTGVFLAARQEAHLSVPAGHQWLTHPSGPGDWCGPAGKGPPASSDHPLPGRSEGCLIVWSGDDIVGWFTRNDQTLIVDRQGQLYFGPNDNDVGDNQGSLTVNIEIRGKRPTPAPRAAKKSAAKKAAKKTKKNTAKKPIKKAVSRKAAAKKRRKR